MAASTNQLLAAKQKLSEVLGERFKTYLNCLRLWFSQKLTKDEFDIEARKILSGESIHAHNEFLLAFFNKCQSPCTGRDSASGDSAQNRDKTKKTKLKAKGRPVRVTFEKRFVPAVPSKHVPHAKARDPSESAKSLGFCSREHCLPDALLVHGRMFVIAWDCGLDSVDDRAVQLVMTAVKHQVKEVLTAVLSRRNAYKLREGRFQFALGCTPANPYLRNSRILSNLQCHSHPTTVSSTGEHLPEMVPTLDWAESEAALEVACDPTPRPRLPPVSAMDLVEALQVHKGCIPSHTVYTKSIEQALAAQWHPSHEELDQEQIRAQEDAIRSQLLEEQQNLSW
ncbi:unnamed protein product [Ixodes pacificus]